MLWPDCWAGVGVGATTVAMLNCGPDGGLGSAGISRGVLTPLEWPKPIHMTSAARTRPAAIIMRRQIRDWSGAVSFVVMRTPQTWAGVSDLGRCLLNEESRCHRRGL